MGITKWMVENYGGTDGCPGCRAINNKTSKQTHNAECRKRFINLSEVPGNEELKAKLNKGYEKITKRFLNQDNEIQNRNEVKRARTSSQADAREDDVNEDDNQEIPASSSGINRQESKMSINIDTTRSASKSSLQNEE